MLATLLRPDAGRAEVLGHDVVTDGDRGPAPDRGDGPDGLRRRGADRAREPVLIWRLQGYDRKAALGRADDLLAVFGLEPRPRRSSSSTTQVACAAGSTSRRASSSRPELLFLDEPTTGLDPRSRNEVWEIVRALVAPGDDGAAVHAVPRRGRPARRRASRSSTAGTSSPRGRRASSRRPSAAARCTCASPTRQRTPGRHGAPRAGARWRASEDADPAALSVSARARPRRRGVGGPRRATASRSRPSARPAEPRRGLPGPDRGARAERHRRRGGTG